MKVMCSQCRRRAIELRADIAQAVAEGQRTGIACDPCLGIPTRARADHAFRRIARTGTAIPLAADDI